ncbi:MAG: primosomal protein N' [Candidatus Dasytiphilus stammeri]
MLIVQVAIYIPLTKYFDYLLPSHLNTVIGARVNVPFGNRNVTGIVVKIKNDSNLPLIKLKPINKIIDNQSLFPNSLWRILNWAADYYHHPLGEVIFNALPILLRKGQPVVPPQMWHLTKMGRDISLDTLKNYPKQQQAIATLKKYAIYHCDIFQYNLNINTLRSLCKKGLSHLYYQVKSINTWNKNLSISNKIFNLNPEQIKAINIIRKSDNYFSAWLLDGITGSGKTEVYLNVIENILTRGQQVLVLVPEIGLTPQTLKRFRERFNVPIEVLHSNLNNSEKFKVWFKAKQGELAIIIGTRSALFIPFANLGIIIIDEEHDISYKQQDTWRYHARDLAVLLAKEANIPIIMGSATPALETLYNVRLGKYKNLKLSKRAGNAGLCKQFVINLRGLKLQSGLSPLLKKHIAKHLQANNQVLLFLNKRGFSTSLICHECGWIAKCLRCDHGYTLHLQDSQLRCHYCNSNHAIPYQCLQCTKSNLIPVGLGTEQLEINLCTLFPKIPISRIDSDTVKEKKNLQKKLNEVQLGGPRILVGTQMLAKGHHFPEVTLVALLDVDGALFSADFRSAERFAQLYTQVAGRAGRENKHGEVILQTYHPHHPILSRLLHDGYHSFANQALYDRKNRSLPPYTNHVRIRAESSENTKSRRFIYNLMDILDCNLLQKAGLSLIGPAPALKAKCNGLYRWQLLLQHHSRYKLQQIIKINFSLINNLAKLSQIKCSFDVDPIEN